MLSVVIATSESEHALVPTLAALVPGATAGAVRTPLIEALSLLRIALGGRPGPDQGLIISKALYAEVGGHRADAADPEAALIRSLGRRRIVMLRNGATATRARDR